MKLRWLCALVCLSALAAAQETIPQLETAKAAFSGGQTIHAVTLAGSFVAGSDAGSFSARIAADGTFSLTLQGKDQRSEDIRLVDKQLTCFATVAEKETELPKHNCLDPVNWMLPMMSLQTTNITSSLVASDAEAVKIALKTNLEAQRVQPGSQTVLGQVELRLLGDSSAPKELLLTRHADDDVNTKIPVQIDYSEYKQVDGILIPHRIERRVNDLSAITLQISSVISEK